MKPVYMDHHATTPMDSSVFEAMLPYLKKHFGNPSSTTHEYGRTARKAVEKSREQIAHFLNAAHPEDIVFTSGATESDNLAIKGLAFANLKDKGHIITTGIEHKAILDTVKQLKKIGFSYSFVKVDKYGIVDLNHLQELLTNKTLLVSIQAANSEIGTTQPIQEIGKMAKEHGVPFHTDAVQGLGKMDIDVVRDHIDMLSISAHKMYGPKGIGGLYVRKGLKLSSLIDGGGHERGMRSGTLNVPGIVGLAKACEIAQRDMPTETARLKSLRDDLIKKITNRIQSVKLNGHPTQRLVNNANFSFSYVEGESLILACRDVALSSGSACTSESLQSSYVLREIGVPDSLAHCSIRFGLGRVNTKSDIELVVRLLEKNVQKLRELSPLYDMAKEGIDIDNFSWSKHSH